jgi:hypothetical protein
VAFGGSEKSETVGRRRRSWKCGRGKEDTEGWIYLIRLFCVLMQTNFKSVNSTVQKKKNNHKSEISKRVKIRRRKRREKGKNTHE